MTKSIKQGLWIGAILLTLTVLSGCKGLLPDEAALPDDGPMPNTSKEAAVRFIEKSLTATRIAAESGVFTLTLTDEEATSLLNVGTEVAEQMQALQNVDSMEQLQQLQQSEEFEDLAETIDIPAWQELLQNGERFPDINLPDLRLRATLREPSVHFTAEGHVIVRGYGEIREYRQPLRVVVAPRAKDGNVELDFVEGQLGPVNMPEELFDLVGVGLVELLMAGQEYAEIIEITVTEGTLTLRGRRTP
jgi:hypothetical protein